MRRFWMLTLGLAGCPGAQKTETGIADSGPVDADGDGFDETVDCDDADGGVFPGAGEVARDGIDNDCDPATCFGGGYAETWDAWALPADYGSDGASPFDQASAYASCSDGTPAHVLADLTGDGQLDLVVTFVCGDELTGDTRWLVHSGEEHGFAEVNTEWAVPADYGEAGAAPFANSVAAAVCGDGIPAHTLTDITGDGVPDLVITEVCEDETVGRDHWLVHVGQAGGFAQVATEWTLPAGYGDASNLPFDATTGASSCGKSLPSYGLTDLTGDGAPDLVVTESCAETSVGETEWLVYPGETGGFGPATSWALPVGVASLSGVTSCGQGVLGHETGDLDGDGFLDLIITAACDGDDTVGDTRWIVYAGGATGFASAGTDCALPPDYGAAATTPFSSTEEIASANDATPGHQLVDLDGDGRLDLVVTEVPGDGVTGFSSWKVHFGEAGGFAPTAWAWPIPHVFVDPAFTEARTSVDCDAGLPAWLLTEISGDGLPDIVVTADCYGTGTGDTSWTVLPGACEP